MQPHHALETRALPWAPFTVVSTPMQWPGAEATVSPRCTCGSCHPVDRLWLIRSPVESGGFLCWASRLGQLWTSGPRLRDSIWGISMAACPAAEPPSQGYLYSAVALGTSLLAGSKSPVPSLLGLELAVRTSGDTSLHACMARRCVGLCPFSNRLVFLSLTDFWDCSTIWNTHVLSDLGSRC